MAWRRPGNRPLSEPMMVISLTHICITRPKQVNSSPLDIMAAILADNIFLNENDIIPIRISLKFVPKGPIDNKAALVQVMAWRWTGDHYLNQCWPSSLTHICGTRWRWRNKTKEAMTLYASNDTWKKIAANIIMFSNSVYWHCISLVIIHTEWDPICRPGLRSWPYWQGRGGLWFSGESSLVSTLCMPITYIYMYT